MTTGSTPCLTTCATRSCRPTASDSPRRRWAYCAAPCLVLETNVPEGEQPYVIELINPEIIESSGEQYGPEGCLSVPGRFGS